MKKKKKIPDICYERQKIYFRETYKDLWRKRESRERKMAEKRKSKELSDEERDQAGRKRGRG